MKTTRKTFLGGMTAMGTMGWRAFAAPARKQRSYVDTTWWDPYVENITDTDTYLRRKFRQDVTDKATGLGTQALKKRLSEVVAAAKASGESWRITKAKLEVRCLVVPGCTDGEDLVARHRYLASLGIPEKLIVDLEYYDYARSKYLALGMKDTMPPKKVKGEG